MKPPFISGGFAYRISGRKGLGCIIRCLQTGFSVLGQAALVYDDGTTDVITFPKTSTPIGQTTINGDHPATADGWVVGLAYVFQPTGGAAAPSPSPGGIYSQTFITSDSSQFPANVDCFISQGYIGPHEGPMLGVHIPRDFRATYIFQGTVVSDATVGTHISTLTITGAAGHEFELIAGQIILNGAAALASRVAILDPTGNEITALVAGTAAATINFPFSPASAVVAQPASGIVLSGLCSLVLTATTSTVSQTQTFAVLMRIKGVLPIATLADNVGTPTLTTNTNGVF